MSKNIPRPVKYSGFKDKKGVPICDNDLLKIFHFKSNSGHLFYMYKRALKIYETYYLVANEGLGILPLDKCHRCIIDKYMNFDEIEVIDGDPIDHPLDKTYIHWSDRKLKRNIFIFKESIDELQ